MKALMVIDMQNATVGKNHAKYFKYDGRIVDDVNKVISDNNGNLIIYIRNYMEKKFFDFLAPCRVYPGSVEGQLVSNLNMLSNYVFDKYEADAFTNPKLDVFLKKFGVNEIEFVGVDGGGCVSITALSAIEHGYKVIINTRAIGTMFTKKKEKNYRRLAEMGAKFI